MSTNQAARTAATALAEIERWSRYTAHATMAMASLLALLTAIVCYGAWEYARLKSAVTQAQSQLADNLNHLEPFRSNLRPETLRTTDKR